MSEKTALKEASVPAERTWGPDEERALRLWISLARCYQTFSRAVGQKIAEYGLTMPQFGILEALLHLGPLTLGELAEKLLVTGGNVTYVMDRLEEEGLVYRERCGEDRRVIYAKLTPEGREVIEGAFPGHGEFVLGLMDHVDLEEVDEARRLLKKLGLGVAEKLEED